MSWGTDPASYEGSLEANGVGKDAGERKAMARQLFALDRAGLLKALQSAPEILFVAAAGNSNDDTGFNEGMPSSFELPNLITVGAVDQAGDATGFTSYGKTVQVYATGCQVKSVVPGGTRIQLSGTSMASPAIVNLAAKMLAVQPRLRPPELIRRIVDGSTRSADGKRLVFTHSGPWSCGEIAIRQPLKHRGSRCICLHRHAYAGTFMTVSIPEAAQRLSVSVDSIRRRVRSGVLPASRDDRGQWWLDLSGEEPATARPVHGDRISLGVATPLQRNGRESLINALEDQVDDLKVRLDRSETERRDEGEKFRTERERLLSMIERLASGEEK